jgi:peptidoglycan/LPS O-acetylase OafA/YrhL
VAGATFGRLGESRANSLDLVRLVAASLVILAHSFFLLGRGGEEPIVLATRGQTHSGELAVHFFFLISGFLITQSWLATGSLYRYLQKRALRIYPGFVVCVLLGTFVVGVLGAASAGEYLGQLRLGQVAAAAANLHGPDVPPVFPNNAEHTINGSLWTIRIEFEAYLMAAVLGLLGVYRRRALVLAAFGVALVLHNFPGLLPAVAYRFRDHLHLLVYFFAGMTFYLYRDRIPFSGRLFWAGVAVVVLAAGLGAVELAMPLFGSYALLFLGFHPAGRALARLTRRADLSYGVYLYGWPTQQLLIHWTGGHLHPYTLTLLALGGAALLAWLSWHLVEAPFLRLKPGRPRPVERGPSPPQRSEVALVAAPRPRPDQAPARPAQPESAPA